MNDNVKRYFAAKDSTPAMRLPKMVVRSTYKRQVGKWLIIAESSANHEHLRREGSGRINLYSITGDGSCEHESVKRIHGVTWNEVVEEAEELAGLLSQQTYEYVSANPDAVCGGDGTKI
jgi:hypothetical protein